MKPSHLIVLLNLGLGLLACSGTDYASVAKEVNEMLAKDVALTAEDKSKVMALREEGERLHKEGKAQESVEALKQARDILQRAKDADLLRKSEG
ncbi:MAG: hypothetical protein GTO41_26885 [Burkholderiales bacterium]|nr:hypothetical protein [Burkholderiales bacterium]